MSLMRLPTVAAVAALLFAAACAEPSSTESSGDEAAVTATDPDYMVFASHAEALAWFEPGQASMAGSFGPISAVAPEDDPRIPRIRAMIRRHWAAIVPRFAPRIPAPRVLLLEAPRSNAAIVFEGSVGKTVDAMLISTAMLARPDAEIEATLAHELGHLVMKNVDPARGVKMMRHYAVTPGSPEPLGLVTADDPAVRSVLAPWLRHTRTFGTFSAKELKGVPMVGNVFALLSGTV